MSVELRNDKLSLFIDLPEEGYKSTRFDYTGKIRKVICNDLVIGTTETDIYDIKKGCGFYNEFGIDSPLGYNEVDVGEEFIKPGVGYLKKISERPYDFYFEYPMRPFNYDYSIEGTRIKYYYNCKYDGYSFEAHKEIGLNDNRFYIKYIMENKGDKVIRTNEYVHNFLAVNSQNLSRDYKLIFPFNIIQEEIHKVIDKESNLIFGENYITWRHEPYSEFFLDTIKSNCISKWVLINRPYKCEISEEGNFSAQKINIWGKRHVVSPELFKKIELNPGEKDEWVRIFSFADTNENV